MSNKKETENVGFWLPNQCTAKMDILTPHKLAVVFLIQEYLSLKKAAAAENSVVELTAEDRKKFCMLLLKLIQYPDMPYKDLYNLLISPIYGIHSLHLAEFEKLMRMLNTMGIEVLFDLHSIIDKLITDNTSSYQIGIVGLYLRRVYVTLDKMTFPEFMSLYKSASTYYEKGVRAVAISANAYSMSESVMNVDNELIYKDRNNHCKWSIKQSELFVAQQSSLLQNNETNALPPKDMQGRLNEIIQDNPKYSQAYFLSYMNSVRIRDIFNAVDALHRSFDRSSSKSSPTLNEFKEYQYSSLNLAILHTQFNHNEEAMASIKECIMLAQENSDRVCLQLAQSWLCQLDKSRMQLTEKNIASKELFTLVHAISLGIQALIKVSSATGYTPSKLFEILLKSDILNCQHSMMDLIANCISERAALWAMYGKNEISSLCSQLLLNSDLRTLGKTYNGEGICQSLCSLALWLSLQGEFNLSAVVLKHTKERFPRYPLSKSWMIADYYITSLQAIFRGKWEEASNACSRLYTLDKNLSILQKSYLNIARGNAKSANTFLKQLLDDENIEHLTRVRALILSSNTLMMTSDNLQMEVINVLNDALVLATKSYLDYEKAIIEMHFSYVLLIMNLPQQALKTIKSCLENILSNGGIYDKAKVLFLFVKCTVAAEQKRANKLIKITECLSMLEQVVEQFFKLECFTKVKDVYFYLATLYNDLEMVEERNKYSYKFRQVDEQYPTSSEYLNLFF